MGALEIALALAKRDIPVFPLAPDKTPLTSHGFKDASKDPEVISKWFQTNPDALLGVPTGAESGIFVLDIDRKSGVDGSASLKARGWGVPLTLTHETVSGGRHYLFRNPKGGNLPSTAGKLGPGIDTRGEGGYVAWWPSKGLPVLCDEPLADVPEWLTQALWKRALPVHRATESGAAIPNGARNSTLTKMAGSLRHHGAPEDEIVAALMKANERCSPPLETSEVEAVAKSVARYDPPAAAAKVEPEPLRASIAPAQPYPVAALGQVLGGAAKAICESVKAPLAMCCQSVLAAASLAAQAHFDVKLPWGERKPLSLFLLTVGESGERKSAVDDLVVGAAKRQEREDMEKYSQESQDYEAELSAWNHAVEAAKKSATAGKKGGVTSDEVRRFVEGCGAKPDAPIVPLRFVTDPTIEGLFKLLAQGQPSVALFSDEGGLLIGGNALNSENALKTMSRWCKFWDGAPFDRVRAGDGASILYGRRVAFHQLAQPDVMSLLTADRMANDQGLLSRCLVAWPTSTIGTRMVDHYEWAGDRREVKKLDAVLKKLMETAPPTGKSEQELNPTELPLSAPAVDVVLSAQNAFEHLMAKGEDLAEIRGRASKAIENACRIAGVLAVIESGKKTREIGIDHIQAALVLIQWYLAEAIRIRSASIVPQPVLDAESLLQWLKDKEITAFRSTVVLNGGPNQLRNKPRLMLAIGELVKCGYLAENEPGSVIDGVKARMSWSVLHVV